MSKKHIEFIKSVQGYEPGDRVWRSEEGAERLVQERMARYVTDEEIEARQADVDTKTDEPLNVQVMFTREHGKYNADDKVWRTESDAEQLVRMGVARKVQVHTQEQTQAKPEEDKAQILRETRAAEIEGIPYQQLWSLASAVAKRTDHEFEERDGDTLREFILDHWPDYKAVTA